MKEIISRLKTLNELDVKLRMIKKDMERLPKELIEQQNQTKALKASIERMRADIIKLKIQSDSIELEVKSGEDTIKRYSQQMNVMRTSKEFEAIKRQMDAQRAWNKENESKVLELLEQIDAKQKDADSSNESLTEKEKVLAAETARINKEIAELKVQFDEIGSQRAKMAVDLPEKELAVYNRIVNSHGEAIANVARGICSACFMKIPPQYHNLALLGKELVCCPSCGRILTANAS